jgi:heavy metal translocating P-type ATPase
MDAGARDFKLTSLQDLFKLLWMQKSTVIAVMATAAIIAHLICKFAYHAPNNVQQMPLVFVLIAGGLPLLFDLTKRLWQRKLGADLLGGLSIVTSIILGEYLAGTIIVLMLSSGEALEGYAVQKASSALAALAKRIPSVAHRKTTDGKTTDGITTVALPDIAVDDLLVVYPHEICPVDGVVTEGHGKMDESYLTGEPFQITKTTGSQVISGALNGDSVLTVRATKLVADSRYAKIMLVMAESESKRPQLQRLGDQIGAIFAPIALVVALLAWLYSGDATRFLAVLVVATPCPLLIAIPVAVIGSISLCASRAIIVKSPVVLEQIGSCRTAIFDKTGTLTHGLPKLTEQIPANGFSQKEILALVAALERYSRHPLARAILAAAKDEKVELTDASDVSEAAGQGLSGMVQGRRIQITSRNRLTSLQVPGFEQLPPVSAGLECVVVVDNRYAGVLLFRDAPRKESKAFIDHLSPKHNFARMIIVSGDRDSEVRYLAGQVGITEIYSEQKPEEKVAIVRRETAAAKTLYVGDGINDAPAMLAATVGMAIGESSDVTTEAAGVVIMDSSLEKVDEFIHISRRMRIIALQSALGGMILSTIGMAYAAAGYLDPISGAITQEIIDVLSIANALRAAFPLRVPHDLDLA